MSEEFGEATEYGAHSKNGETNSKWIGAKFDLEDETDQSIVAKAEELRGSMSMKKLIAEMIVYVHTSIKGADEEETEEETEVEANEE